MDNEDRSSENMDTSSENTEIIEDFGSDGIDYSDRFVTSDVFDSHMDAIDWAKKIAIENGFEIVISSHKQSGKVRLLRCSRGERYRGVMRNFDTALRKFTKTKACKCPFRLWAEQLSGYTSWIIIAMPGESGKHNHGLSVYPEGHRQISGLSSKAKEIVRDMTKAQAKPCSILASLKDKFPEDNPTRRHVYNYRDKMRKEDMEDRDVVGQFYHLARESKYVHWTLTEPDTNVVTHLFMAHPSSVELLRTFPWFIGMDSTYKTNKYKMPLLEIIGMTSCNQNFLIAYAFMKDETEVSYTWVLQRLRTLIGFNVHPYTIVTDRELGLMRPIAEIFPQTAHLLCTWHINKDVEDKVYRLCGKEKVFAQMFKRGKWKKLIEAPSEPEYHQAVRLLEDGWKHRPKIISYIKHTWLPYKEKFVAAWTNKIMHFGNTTTCRVESAHAELKQWLNTSTGALDTVWKKIDKEIEAQMIRIRYSLEECRNKIGGVYSGFPCNYLNCFVSHYCLQLIAAEAKRMWELSKEVHIRCGCLYKTTHGIPCACELYENQMNQIPISLDRIHPFWRTLIIADGPAPNSVDSSGHHSEDHKYFRSLVEEVNRSDPATVRNISLLIHNQLHPDETAFVEPEVNISVRGRPKGNTSTKRQPSAWEYSLKGRGRGRSSNSNKRFCSSSSARNTTTSSDFDADASEFRHMDKIPSVILPFVSGIVDVIGDGNCGFRVVADYIFGDQEQWHYVRVCVANEIMANRHFYETIYIDGVDAGHARIMWDGGSCGQEHWMTVIADLFPIATIFNAIVVLFGYGNGGNSTYACVTVLPLRAPSTARRPAREIIIGHLGNSFMHYVRLNMDVDFPLPPVAASWYTKRDDTVADWDQLYARRRAMWDRIIQS